MRRALISSVIGGAFGLLLIGAIVFIGDHPRRAVAASLDFTWLPEARP